ncbi:enoyl-CoA hydratase [Siccirubricoccus sp. KC 17139]|uniref:Enoyl-CoA hydratase n=1 Tax=Siccirubricoccus soli TaxID=2899147 RepID=A0ABT1D465_9PROT|nr:enoyl-CoA hydratase [Siccirubricoccus soli]MCO6416417.1 enoyl-CoA hydratase [Siccirubricoccus soli]MCP2682551.1 enoyl-CoA hydratase [Siccirubricoccus soli]
MAGEIRVARQGNVARITIDHAAKLNTLNPPLMREFVAAMAALSAEEGLAAAVLTGAGEKAFIGGADISVMAGLADGGAAREFITLVHGCCQAVRDCPVPVIGRLNGWTLGAGLELAAACDLRIAADTARFGMPEVRVGIPSVVEAALLPGLIGWGRTRRLLLLGETIDAAEAAEWGLVEKVVPGAALDSAVEDWLHLLGEAGPRSLRLQKALIRRWEELPMREAIAAGIDSFASAWESEEPRRMLGAFAQRKR